MAKDADIKNTVIKPAIRETVKILTDTIKDINKGTKVRNK